MFQIHSGDYADMIEAYKKLETVLEEERETLQAVVDKSEQSMSGNAIYAFQQGYKRTLNLGAYAKLMEHLKSMYTSMEELQPLMNQIIAEGKLLGEQLDSDDLLYPGVSDVVASSNSEIVLDDAYTNLITSGCDEVLDLGDSLKTSMETVFSYCEGLLDFSEEKTQLAEAYTCVKRVENFQIGFNRYVRGVRDLDDSLNADFQRLIVKEEQESGKNVEADLKQAAQYGQITELQAILEKDPTDWTDAECELLTKSWERAVDEGNIDTMSLILEGCVDEKSGRLDYYRMGIIRENSDGEAWVILDTLMQNELPAWSYADCIIEVSKEGGALTVLVTQDVLLEEDNTIKLTVGDTESEGSIVSTVEIVNRTADYSEETYEIAAGFLEKDEAGNYQFETILKQDAAAVGEKEKEILALLYEDKCRVIETASSRETKEEQFEITERFVEGLFRMQMYSEPTSIFISNGEEWIHTDYNIYADPKWTSSLMQYVQREDSVACLMLSGLQSYKKGQGENWQDITNENSLVNVKITPQLRGMTAQLEFVKTDALGSPKEDVIYVPSKVKIIDYLDTLDDEYFEHLKEMGYTEQTIVDTYMQARAVADEGFIDSIMKGEYKAAFLVNPEELSNDACYILPQYAARFYNTIDKNGYCEELETFINSMLYQDENEPLGYYHVDDYLKLMYTQSGKWREERIGDCYAGTIEMKDAKWYITMDILWGALYDQYCKGDICMPQDPLEGNAYYILGECMLQVKDVKVEGIDNIIFKLMLTDEAYKEEQSDCIIYNQREITVKPERNSAKMSQLNTELKIKELEKEIDKLWLDAALESGTYAVDIVKPGTGAKIRMALAVLDNDLGGVIENGMDTEEFENSKYAEVGPFIKPVLSTYKYNREWEELMKDLNETQQNEIATWFYAADTYDVSYYDLDGGMQLETVCMGQSVSDYATIQSIQQWNDEGFGGILQGHFPDKERAEIQDKIVYIAEGGTGITSYKMLNEEEKAAFNFFVYGTESGTEYESLLDIEPATFLKCVTVLEDCLEKEEFRDYIGVTEESYVWSGQQYFHDDVLREGVVYESVEE